MSCATISIGNRVAADRLRDRDHTAGIGNNSAEIGDDAAGILYIAARSDTMLNSVLNGDWSNSLPGRQFPKGITIKYRDNASTGL